MRRAHGHAEEEVTAAPRKIILNRRTQSEIKVAGPVGKAKTVTIEVRRKRTYVNRESLEHENKVKQNEIDRQRQLEQDKIDQEKLQIESLAAAAREKLRKKKQQQLPCVLLKKRCGVVTSRTVKRGKRVALVKTVEGAILKLGPGRKPLASAMCAGK